MEDYLKAYKFEIIPNDLQKAFLAAHFGCCRLIYNKTLGEILPKYEAYREAVKEFYSHPQNQEKKDGRFVVKFTPEEQEKFFYSFPENKDKDFIAAVKPPISRNSIKRKDSGITKVSDYRDIIKDDNGICFLKDVDSSALNGVIDNIERAFKNYERRVDAGLPKFKKKRGYQSYNTSRIISSSEDKYNLTCGNLKFDADNGKILLPKFAKVWKERGEVPGWIKVIAHRDIRLENNPCYISNVTVSLTPEGKYYATLLVHYQKNPFETLNKTNKSAGVSVSLSSNAYVIADDYGVKYRYNANLEKLHRIDKHVADLKAKRSNMKRAHKDNDGNFVPPSNNYIKISLKINKLLARRSRMVEYTQHCVSKELIEKYDKIYVRDFEAKDFIESKKAENPDMTNDDISYLTDQAKSLAMGGFLAKLEYKAEAYNRVLYKIDKYYPCSKTCSCCGKVVEDRVSLDGKWTCPYCVTVHKTCENSAKNILREGQTILVSPQEYKKDISSRKQKQEYVIAAIKSRIFDVLREYNENNTNPVKINKGKITSLARVLSKKDDITDDEIIEKIKELTSNKKRSKIKK